MVQLSYWLSGPGKIRQDLALPRPGENHLSVCRQPDKSRATSPQGTKITIKSRPAKLSAVSLNDFADRLSRKTTSCRCLDAAHGKTERPVEAVNRRHFALEKAQVASIEITGCEGRRRPGIAVRTDNIQGSRLVAAVARSRSKKQSLEGMRRRGKQFRIHNLKFTMHN